MLNYKRIALLAIGSLAISHAAAQNIEPSLPAADPLAGLPNVKIEFYDVSGTDEASINASLAANAPRRPDGSQALGATSYYFRFGNVLNKLRPVCTIAKADIQVESTIHLPRLVNPALVPERIMVRWRPFVAGLRMHEAGHVRIENDHLKDIKAAVIGSKCADLNATMDQATAKVALLQKAYDRETGDGATQGAVLR